MLVNGKQMHIAIGPGDVGRYVDDFFGPIPADYHLHSAL